MSKRAVTAQHPTLARGDLVSSSLEICCGAHQFQPHAVSHSQLRFVARLPALPVLRSAWPILRSGGAYRDRTDDLMLAKQPLSQLS